jgi:large subunit ribosomal protein L25
MDKVVLKASRRTVTGKQVGVLRRNGQLPGILYGHNLEPIKIVMNLRDASRLLSTLSSSSLVTIDVDGVEHSALVREKQRNYIRGNLLHVDFQAVSLTEKIRAKVGLVFQGLSLAVKDLNGLIVENLDELDIEAFPQDLPEKIIIDVSVLNKIGDSILVKDVKVSEKVLVLTNPDEVIAVVTLSGQEEEEVVVAPVAVAEPEVIERGKKEEEAEK